MGLVHNVNTCEIPLFLRRIPEEDSEITKARNKYQAYLDKLKSRVDPEIVLDVLSALCEPSEEVAA
jgi:hypothetical protein